MYIYIMAKLERRAEYKAAYQSEKCKVFVCARRACFYYRVTKTGMYHL